MEDKFRLYNQFMRGMVGRFAYEDLGEAARAGYKSEVWFIKFMVDVQDYMIATAVRHNSKPNWSERLHRRAKNHECDTELRSIISAFRKSVKNG